jgi:pyridoxine/pyridoxamine 5'-phosphate oxidase
MKREKLLEFLRAHRLAVQASVTRDGAPQAAVVGYAVSDALELVFDTVTATRKFANLQANPRIALVVGWEQVTAQLDGSADFPTGAELERVKELYFSAYPDGRERLAWPGITHVRVRPTWARYSDFAQDPPEIWELSGAELG